MRSLISTGGYILPVCTFNVNMMTSEDIALFCFYASNTKCCYALLCDKMNQVLMIIIHSP